MINKMWPSEIIGKVNEETGVITFDKIDVSNTDEWGIDFKIFH